MHAEMRGPLTSIFTQNHLFFSPQITADKQCVAFHVLCVGSSETCTVESGYWLTGLLLFSQTTSTGFTD